MVLPMTNSARAYVCWVVAAGSVVIVAALSEGQFTHTARFPLYFALAILASTIKIRFPAITTTFSSNSLFIILAAVELDPTEAMLIACAAAAAQTLLNAREKPNPVQLVFNIAVFGISTSACLSAAAIARWCGAGGAVALCCAAVGFYLFDNLLVSGIVALLRETSVRHIWRAWLLWTTPAFVFSTAAAMVLFISDLRFQWRPALVSIPIAVGLQMGYRKLIDARFKAAA
jgi:hypothetical protein